MARFVIALCIVLGVFVFLMQFTCRAREAAQRTQSRNNLKAIGLALHEYHKEHGRFPDAYSRDENGYPLLSWRVHLLPYLDQTTFYEKFKLDEPWHSPHNQSLIEQMPKVFRNPFIESEEPKTNYLLPIADGMMFARGKGRALEAVTDHTSHTIMAVEANADQSVTWTKPEDLAVNIESPQEVMIGFWSGQNLSLVLMVDGSVQILGKGIDVEVLRGLLTCSGGEQIGPEEEMGL